MSLYISIIIAAFYWVSTMCQVLYTRNTSYFIWALQYSSGKGTIWPFHKAGNLFKDIKYLAPRQSLQSKCFHPGGWVLALHLVLFGKTWIKYCWVLGDTRNSCFLTLHGSSFFCISIYSNLLLTSTLICWPFVYVHQSLWW